jgi:superfamily I DNA/RNA helicase
LSESGRIMLGTMHFAKGLEFRAVAVMACDEGVIPAQQRVADVSDEMERDEVYATERQLLVAPDLALKSVHSRLKRACCRAGQAPGQA